MPVRNPRLMYNAPFRPIGLIIRTLRVSSQDFGTSNRLREAAVPATKPETETAVEEAQPKEVGQAPNRADVWSRSQRPRSTAMTGPRFEQTDFDLQVGAQEWLGVAARGNTDSATAPTSVGDGDDTQAACAVDSRPRGSVRWRWRPYRAPQDLHQHRQA